MPHEQHDAAHSGQRVEWSKSWQYHFDMGIVRARTVKFNVKIASFGARELKPHICAHGQIRQILCYTCGVVCMTHEQHDAP